MKLYKSFYAVLLGITTLPFCAWGMENQSSENIPLPIITKIKEAKANKCARLKNNLTHNQLIDLKERAKLINEILTLKTEKNLFKNQQIDNLVKNVNNFHKKDTLKILKRNMGEICQKSQNAFTEIAKRLPSELNMLLLVENEKKEKLKNEILNDIDLMITFIQMKGSSERLQALSDTRNAILSSDQYQENDIIAWENNIKAVADTTFKKEKNAYLESGIQFKQIKSDLEKNPKLNVFPTEHTLAIGQKIVAKKNQPLSSQTELSNPSEAELLTSQLESQFTQIRKQQLEAEEQNKKEPELQELIEQQAQKKIKEAQTQQEKLTKEQKKLDREKLNSIKDELSNLKEFKKTFTIITTNISPLQISYENIQKLEELQQKYPSDQKILDALKEYNDLFAEEADLFIKKIISPFSLTSAADNSKQIDTYFPVSNKDLADYREKSLINLTSKTIHELGQKNVINYTLQDKTSTIENILLLARNFNYLNEEQKALFNQQNNLNRLFNTASYDILEEAIKPEEKEKFKQAWDAIREKVGYVPFKTESTQPSEQQTIEQPINVNQKQPEQKPINTPSTQPVQLSPEKLKIEQNLQNQKEELEKEKQNLKEKVKQQKEELKSLKQENTSIFATIRGAIGGFLSAIANTASNFVNYIRSLFS